MIILSSSPRVVINKIEQCHVAKATELKLLRDSYGVPLKIVALKYGEGDCDGLREIVVLCKCRYISIMAAAAPGIDYTLKFADVPIPPPSVDGRCFKRRCR